MRIELNGHSKELSEPATVAELLVTLGLERAPCAVEVNAKLVRKALHSTHALVEGDRVEVVTLVGGG
jgi:sulfur carrier protein